MEVMEKLCDLYGLYITLCHYPREHQNETLLNIVCSVKSPKTGRGSPSPVMKRCSSLFEQQKHQQD
jgi:hypothetical protein